MLDLINQKKGSTLLLVLTLTFVFLATLGGLATLGVYRHRLYQTQAAELQARHVTESGINYYKWHLIHDGQDFYDGTCNPGPCQPGPYTHTIDIPNTHQRGTFQLNIVPPTPGSTIVTIESTGWLNDYPNIKKEIIAQYGKESLARYNFLANDMMMIENFETDDGLTHSNNGVFVIGTTTSLVTASVTEWNLSQYFLTPDMCTTAFLGPPGSNCYYIGDPTYRCHCSMGVVGHPKYGTREDLWEAPTTPIDFASFNINLNQIKADIIASKINGTFYDKRNDIDGYHVYLKADGTYTRCEVTELLTLNELNYDNWRWGSESREIATEENCVQNLPVPIDGVLYFINRIWIEGTVNGRFTIISADLNDTINQTEIVVTDDIKYVSTSTLPEGDMLGLIAEDSIRISAYAPANDDDSLEIDANLLAKDRNIAVGSYGDFAVCQRAQRMKLTIYGGKIFQTWWIPYSGGLGPVRCPQVEYPPGSGIIHTYSGFLESYTAFDPRVTFHPPPYFPTENYYSFVSWNEVN